MKTAFRNLRLALALCASGALHAATYTWTGGTSNDWNTAANWSGGVVPTSADAVVISIAGGPVLTSLTATTAAFTIGSAANTTGSLALINSSLYSASLNSGGNATGTAFITLDNSTWYVPNNFFLPGTGYNNVELRGNSAITNAGPVATTGNAGLAQNAGAVGVLTLNDNSVWQSANELAVGFRGSGTLYMNDNSKVVTRTVFRVAGNGSAGAPRGWVEMGGAASITVGTTTEIGSTGPGMLIMTGSSSFTGTGNITVGVATGTGKGAVTLSDHALFRTNGTLMLGNSGDGRLTFLNGGAVRVNASAITLANQGASGGAIEIAGDGTHSLTRSDGTTLVGINGGAGTGGAKVLFTHSSPGLVFGNPLTGSLAVEVDGPGLTTLTGTNTYTGGNIVRSGTLAGTTSGIRGDILADGAVILATPAAHTLKLTGAGAFSKLGAGALTLAPASTFAGSAFNLAAGSVAFDGAATLDNTLAVTLASGGTLAGSLVRTAGQSLSAAAGGAITGDVSLNNATLALAPASAGTAPFAIGGGFTFADSTLKLGIFAESDGFIAIGGSISISGVNAIDLAPGLIGTFTLGGFGALAGSALTIDGLPQGAGLRQTATTAAIGGDLRIFFDADISRRLAWTGSASAGWNTSDANWIGSNNTNNYASLDTVVFDGAADAASPANRDITLAGNLRVSDMIVSGDADYTFGGAGGITSGTQIITLPGNPENLADVAGKLKKSGAGTLTLANTGTNNFSGGIEISGGVIAFGNAAQIGTADTSGAPVPITFTDAGGTLKKTGAGAVALPAEINIASSATATFDTDGTLTLSAGVGGDGTLEKAGAGMLDLSGSAARAGPVIITAGTLSAGVENLGATPVTNNAALVLRVDADAGFSASMNGAGALFKTGAGALALSGAIALDAVTVSQGSLVITPASQLAVASAFTIAHGAGLRGAGAFSAAQLANAGAIRVGRAADPAAPHGVMTLTGDYTGAGAARISLDMTLNANGAMDYDRFIINGNADGVTTVSLQEHPSPGRLRGDTSLLPSLGEMISVGGSIAAGAFVHDGTVEFGGGQYRWDSTLNGGAGGWRALVIEPVSAIAALDAAGVIIGKASFAAIEQRLLGLRERRADVTDQKQIWVAGFQRGEELGPMRYDRYETTPGFTADTQGIQAGLDWISAPGAANMFVFGLFADYAKSDIHLPDRGTTGSTDSTGGGLHCSWVRGGWHLSALGRHGREGYDATAARRTPTTPSSTHLIATGYSWGGMISTGYDIALGETGAWVLEPSARFTCQTHNIKNRNIYDSAGRAYNVAHTVSSELLAGIRLSREGVWRDTLKCRPYVRAGYIRDFSSDGRVVVDGEEFRHEFGGDGVEIGGGLWLEIFRDTALQAGIEWFDTAVSRGASATFGIAFAW